ncbi:hypothetical protein BDN72DRAFT_918343 [Pluteus cervinus]|uniref:Uncharacterized protein n=1 Tax=Pluteus cervinus TaxID=181527 RepID=A0ACD2ZWQ9_9AGAR|nr:hypothetical protein BDN72DRAFT_918343 [Pluteus cervinus]
MGLEDGKNVVALTTDSPTVMRSLRRKFQEKFPWVIILGCFLHALNGIVGKISAHADIKPILTKNARIVSFFNTSHYWGGQLKIEAKTMGITRSLQTRTETRWYSMVLQGISLLSYRYVAPQFILKNRS